MIGLGCRPSVPAEIRYRVVLSDSPQLADAAVTRQGTNVGSLSASGTIEFTTPSSVRPSALALAVALPTPCGPRSTPLDLQLTPDADSDRRIADLMSTERVVLLRARLSTNAGLTSSVVLLDRGADARPVRIGEAVIAAPTRATIFHGDCGANAQNTLAIHPEARERFVQAFREAGLTEAAAGL